jgi:hypothetical protein
MSHEQATPRRVIHIVGRLTDSVHRLVGPTTDALSHASTEQVVVLLEDPQNRDLALTFDSAVKRVVLPHARNPIARWRAWLRAVQDVLACPSADAVHLHGLRATLLALPVVHRHAPRRLLLSPHDAPPRAARLAFRLAAWFFRPTARRLEPVAMVSLPSEAQVLRSTPNWRTALVSASVPRPFLLAPREPAQRPLVVGGVLDARASAASRFAQVAVLLGPGDAGVSFSWLGAAHGRVRDELRAAAIDVVDEQEPAFRARCLSSGWVYLCPTVTRGFPGHLIEALACGLPVVAVDSPLHRDIVRDGETGFLCADDAALMTRVAELLRDGRLRERMSEAARQDAWSRFAGAPFENAVLRAYSRDARGPAANVAQLRRVPRTPQAPADAQARTRVHAAAWNGGGAHRDDRQQRLAS